MAASRRSSLTFDEDRIDEVRGQVLTDIRNVVERDKPADVEAHYNGSLEISETYNRVTVSNTEDLTPPILIITIVAIYALFRSVRKTAVILVAIAVSVLWTLGLYSAAGFTFNVLTSMLTPLVIVLAIADDVHIVQHFDHELRTGGDKARGVQVVSGPSVHAAPRRKRHDRARNAVAGDQRCRGRAHVRHRRGDRDHGRLRDLARLRADAADAGAAGHRTHRRRSGGCQNR